MMMEGAVILSLIYFAWAVLFYVQLFMGYGTAYRATKKGGDNGVALFGWMIVYELAALVPGLGIYLWKKSKEEAAEKPQSTYGNNF